MLSICWVIDFQAVLIDGAFPDQVREELVARGLRYIVNQEKRGLITPKIEAGSVGENARSIGAASSPIFFAVSAQYEGRAIGQLDGGQRPACEKLAEG